MTSDNLVANPSEVDAVLSEKFPDTVGVLSFSRGSSGLYALFLALRSSRGPG